MKRLIDNLGKNSPAEYDRIYKIREAKGVDDFDQRRWNALLKYWRGGRLLDVGCLDSLVCAMAVTKRPDAQAIGIDVTPEAIASMQEKYPYATFEVRDGYHNEFPDSHFDYVVLGEVLEHLEDPEAMIQECTRVLKPGGYLAITTPLEEEVEPGAVDGDRHIWSFSEEDFWEMLEKDYDWIRIRVMGSQYFPLYKYHFPNLLIHAKKH